MYKHYPYTSVWLFDRDKFTHRLFFTMLAIWGKVNSDLLERGLKANRKLRLRFDQLIKQRDREQYINRDGLYYYEMTDCKWMLRYELLIRVLPESGCESARQRAHKINGSDRDVTV